MEGTNVKRTILCAALLALLAGATPFLCLLPVFAPAAAGSAPPTMDEPFAGMPTVRPGAEVLPAAPAPTDEPPTRTIPLYDAASEQLLTVPLQSYLVGAAACEMPPTWPDDALRAQMVACHSYALYQRDQGGTVQGAYLTVNSALCSGWTTTDVLKSRWGEDYQGWYDHLWALAGEVLDEVLLYDGAPAAACYHAISTGHTEASQNVWVEALPYLQGVDSAWDREAEDYEVTVQLASQQVYDALAGTLGAEPQGDPDTWVGKTLWDDAGYVKSIELGGHRFTGPEVRGALGLRSACFAIAWQGGQFIVTTRGYGHGVGLSQYGARAMAAGGAGWRSILTYYFPGTEIGTAA